jgi:hypothetical protein
MSYIGNSPATSTEVADNAITLAKMASGTDGNLITYDASGDPAYVTTGTSGQILTSGGAGVAPTFQTAAGGGLYASVAIISDLKVFSATSGTFTSGAWRTRDLNTEINDSDGIVSISSNQFTLQAGTYTIEWDAPAYKVNRHVAKLKNITDGTDVQRGTAAFIHSADNGTTSSSIGIVQLTIASAKAFEIQHRCQTTGGTHGFGLAAGTDLDSGNDTYTLVKILKHS